MRTRKSRTNYQPYFPNGELALDGAEVSKSSQTEFNGEPFEGDCEVNYQERVYFEDIQAYIETDDFSVRVLDVSNAFKPRQECISYKLVWNGDCPTLPERLREAGVETMNDLYQGLMVPGRFFSNLNLREPDGYYGVIAETSRALYTYSPFVTFKPIRNPKRWTKERIWRAIISGQIYRGTYHTEFRDMPDEWREQELVMAELALILINNFNGPKCSIEATAQEGGTSVIKLRRASRAYDSYSQPESKQLQNKKDLDMKEYTLYYDPACDRKEASRRWFKRLMDFENKTVPMTQHNPWEGWQQR